MNRPRTPDDPHASDARSARELTAGGPSQIDRSQAMRVRDIDRPTDEDLTEAEQSVHVVHRNWKPRS